MNEKALAITRQSQGKPLISEGLSDLLDKLSINQIRYCIARQKTTDKGAAAEMIGLLPDTIYTWPAYVDEAAKMVACDGVTTALHLLDRSIGEAMAVKLAGLRSDNERIRQECATEVLDRSLGKAVQRTDVRGSGIVFMIAPPGE